MKKAIFLLMIVMPAGELFAQSNPAGARPGQDTARYSADGYRLAGHGSVGQLLKNIKGFEIGDDGTVFHNGYQVNRAKVNGKNYTGVNIAGIIKKLPANGVISIEMVDDGLATKMDNGRPGNPQEILSIIINEDQAFYQPASPGDRKFKAHGRRQVDDGYAAFYGSPAESNPRNPLDRAVDRAIYNMQATTNSMYEVNDYGDQIPHFIIKDWPGTGSVKLKKGKKAVDAAQNLKPVQP